MYMCIGHYVGIRTNLRTHEKKKIEGQIRGTRASTHFFHGCSREIQGCESHGAAHG